MSEREVTKMSDLVTNEDSYVINVLHCSGTPRVVVTSRIKNPT